MCEETRPLQLGDGGECCKLPPLGSEAPPTMLCVFRNENSHSNPAMDINFKGWEGRGPFVPPHPPSPWVRVTVETRRMGM